MTSLLAQLTQDLSGSSALAIPIALVGGSLAALCPCCMPLYPAAAATCCSTRESQASCCGPQMPVAKRGLANSIAFALGMAVAMSLLGIVASLLGRVTTAGNWLQYLVAVIPLLMGLHILGWIRIPMPSLSFKGSRVQATGAFGVGFLLSLVIAPCGTPILAAVLSYAAIKGNTIYGAVLLFAYGLGAGIPLLVAAGASGRIAQWLDTRGYRVWVDRATGALLLGLGFYLLWIA